MAIGAVRAKNLRLIDHIREQIATGALKPGDRIPSQSQLMAQHNVSYNTVRRALAILENEGVLEGRIGEGVFVVDFTNTREARIAELIRCTPPLSAEAISRLRALLPSPSRSTRTGR